MIKVDRAPVARHLPWGRCVAQAHPGLTPEGLESGLGVNGAGTLRPQSAGPGVPAVWQCAPLVPPSVSPAGCCTGAWAPLPMGGWV